jgi:hypothetical protein
MPSQVSLSLLGEGTVHDKNHDEAEEYDSHED